MHGVGQSHRNFGSGVGKEGVMDFAAVLVVGNTLLAVFIYLVVSKIWQD